MVFNGFGPINERFQARMDSSGEAVNWIAKVCQRDALTKDGLGAQLAGAGQAIAALVAAAQPRGVRLRVGGGDADHW